MGRSSAVNAAGAGAAGTPGLALLGEVLSGEDWDDSSWWWRVNHLWRQVKIDSQDYCLQLIKILIIISMYFCFLYDYYQTKFCPHS